MTFYSIISSNQKRFGKLEKHVDELIYVGTLQQKLECIIQVIQDTVECIALLLNGTVELKNSDGSIYFKQLIYDPVEYAIWFREFGSKVPLNTPEDKYNQWITWKSCCSLIQSPQFSTDSEDELIIYDFAAKVLKRIDNP